MPVYDFVCGQGHTHEERRGYEVSSVPCASCGATAQRVAVYAYQSTITETGGGSYPRLPNAKTANGKYLVSDFQEASAEIDYAAGKIEKREGKPVKMPSAYKAGQQKAERMGAKRRK